MPSARPTLPQDWITQSVQQWHDKLALEAKGTATGYLSGLGTYWRDVLSKKFATIDDWVSQVKQEQESNDINVRRNWAISLENFVNSYVGPKTGRPLVKGSKTAKVSAITSFLKRCLGSRLETYEFTYGTKQERMAELRHNEDVPPVTLDEIKTLYSEAKNRRDKAILSTLSGFGVSEWYQFATEWFKHVNEIREGKVPIRVVVTREKTGITYAAFLWDDAVDDLKQLLDERERELERPLTANDPLFANQYGKQVSKRDVQKTIRRLADRSGVEPRSRSKVSYRIRPHELGRDYFRTQLSLAGVQNNVSEYLLGHKIDDLGYDKFHKTDEGKRLIQNEASKLRAILNINTGRGQPHSEAEAELVMLAKFAKLFTPKAYDKFIEKFPEASRGAATNVEAALDFLRQEVKDMVQPGAHVETTRRSNHEYDYIRTAVESDDYMQALQDGYEDFSTNGGNVHVLRKKKD